MDSETPFDAIVVLGTKVHADGSVGARLQARTAHAIRLFADGQAGHLVFSGGPRGAKVSEAEAMARLALAAGVPKERLLLEPDSGSTWDNARLTATLLRGRGLERIVLVTDAQHMPRAALTFRATGLTVTTNAADWRSVRGLPGILSNGFYEAAATTVYRLRLLRHRRDLTGQDRPRNRVAL